MYCLTYSPKLRIAELELYPQDFVPVPLATQIID